MTSQQAAKGREQAPLTRASLQVETGACACGALCQACETWLPPAKADRTAHRIQLRERVIGQVHAVLGAVQVKLAHAPAGVLAMGEASQGIRQACIIMAVQRLCSGCLGRSVAGNIAML